MKFQMMTSICYSVFRSFYHSHVRHYDFLEILEMFCRNDSPDFLHDFPFMQTIPAFLDL